MQTVFWISFRSRNDSGRNRFHTSSDRTSIGLLDQVFSPSFERQDLGDPATRSRTSCSVAGGFVSIKFKLVFQILPIFFFLLLIIIQNMNGTGGGGPGLGFQQRPLTIVKRQQQPQQQQQQPFMSTTQGLTTFHQVQTPAPCGMDSCSRFWIKMLSPSQPEVHPQQSMQPSSTSSTADIRSTVAQLLAELKKEEVPAKEQKVVNKNDHEKEKPRQRARDRSRSRSRDRNRNHRNYNHGRHQRRDRELIVIAIILEIVIITTTRSEVVEEGVVAEVVVEVVEEGHGTDGVITSQDQAIMIWIALRISRREGEDIHLQRPRPKNGKFVLAPIPIRSRKLNNNPRIV